MFYITFVVVDVVVVVFDDVVIELSTLGLFVVYNNIILIRHHYSHPSNYVQNEITLSD
jgi:hypothetical protein